VGTEQEEVNSNLVRVQFFITEEKKATIDRFVPWGSQGRVFGVLADILCKMLEKGGHEAIGPFLRYDKTLEGEMEIRHWRVRWKGA
jgi:hypothetical protein